MSDALNVNVGSATANIGGIIAAVLSYLKWHSIGYAILHFLCGWIYVIYYLLKYKPF